MGVSNPAETVIGILSLLDQVREKMHGTELAAFSWRPASPGSAEELAALVEEALRRCDDATEALIVVTVAAMATAHKEAS
jgi:hypothetical protein